MVTRFPGPERRENPGFNSQPMPSSLSSQHMISHTWALKENGTNKLIYNTEIEAQTQKTYSKLKQ